MSMNVNNRFEITIFHECMIVKKKTFKQTISMYKYELIHFNRSV